eukprot:351868-Chlamydomonas_euryale.AAC.3
MSRTAYPGRPALRWMKWERERGGARHVRAISFGVLRAFLEHAARCAESVSPSGVEGHLHAAPSSMADVMEACRRGVGRGRTGRNLLLLS